METAPQAHIATAESTDFTVVSGTRMKLADRVVEFSTPLRDGPFQIGAEGATASKRDWSSALDLVSEAFEAIRMADERAAASEEYQNELIQHHADQVKGLDARIAAAEKRAETAEDRAKVAEAWLAKFHDTIMDEFQRSLASRPRER